MINDRVGEFELRVNAIIQTSVDDARQTIANSSDKNLLRRCLRECIDRGHKTRAQLIRRRLARIGDTGARR